MMFTLDLHPQRSGLPEKRDADAQESIDRHMFAGREMNARQVPVWTW